MRQTGKSINQRKNQRFSVCLTAALMRKDRGEEQLLCESDVYDLSLTGCKIFSEVNLDQGRFVMVHLSIPLEESPIQINLAYIRWSADGQSGLEFKVIPEGDRNRLVQYLENLPSNNE